MRLPWQWGVKIIYAYSPSAAQSNSEDLASMDIPTPEDNIQNTVDEQEDYAILAQRVKALEAQLLASNHRTPQPNLSPLPPPVSDNSNKTQITMWPTLPRKQGAPVTTIVSRHKKTKVKMTRNVAAQNRRCPRAVGDHRQHHLPLHHPHHPRTHQTPHLQTVSP